MHVVASSISPSSASYSRTTLAMALRSAFWAAFIATPVLLAPTITRAQTQPAGATGGTDAAGVTTLSTVIVTGAAYSDLPEAYAGGQVARGGTLGVLGVQDVMDTPFSVTNYTA